MPRHLRKSPPPWFSYISSIFVFVWAFDWSHACSLNNVSFYLDKSRCYSLCSKSTGRIGYTSFKRTKKPQKHQQPLVPDVINFAPNANIALCAVDTKPWVWRMSWKFTFQDDIDKILIWDKNLLIMIGQVISGYIKSPWNYLLLFWENQLKVY